MMRERQFSTGRINLHYAEGPANGVPLVLIHGGSARWQSWEPLLPVLIPLTHVFALDLRGHGRSSWRAPYTLEAYTDDLVRFLHDCVGAAAIVCGHSLGGMVALLTAARISATLRGVIVGDSPLDATTWLHVLQETRPRLEEWHTLALEGRTPELIGEALKRSPVEVPGQTMPVPAAQLFGDDSPWFTWMATNLAQLDPATLEILVHNAEQATKGYQQDQVIPAIRCPIWLIQADPAFGSMMPDHEVRRAQQQSTWVQHRRLAGVGHALHATHLEPVRDALLESIRAMMQPTT